MTPAASTPFEIGPLAEADWPAVRAIYEEGIATGHATFEKQAPEWEQWNAAHLAHSRLAARSAAELVGWAALSPVSNRCVYDGVAEVSVYVAGTAQGKGVGSALLRDLIRSSEANGLWTLQAGIFPENLASMTIHLGAGFRILGIREKLGFMEWRWRDVALMERRSTVVGLPPKP